MQKGKKSMNWFKKTKLAETKVPPFQILSYTKDFGGEMYVFFTKDKKEYFYEGVTPEQRSYLSSLLTHKNYSKASKVLHAIEINDKRIKDAREKREKERLEKLKERTKLTDTDLDDLTKKIEPPKKPKQLKLWEDVDEEEPKKPFIDY